MPITDHLFTIKSTIPPSVQLLAVSKFQPLSALEEAYAAGQRLFGENRPQEMLEKYKSLPSDIQWHMIGHLQRNKIALIAPFVSLIESVDSERLLAELSKEATKIGRSLKVLLEVHIATENTKQGFTPDQIHRIMADTPLLGIEIVGLMGMASLTSHSTQIEREFRSLRALYDLYPNFTTLSMGMSGDYSIAIECGATQVRIGSAIFGARTIK
ncbi:MAG: YggS family pyridoxal phosphate-dependent enzyme [Mucinivorans sp.]